METTKRRPRVFIFHTQADWEIVRTLLERLTFNGVDAVLSGEVSDAAQALEVEATTGEAEAVRKIVAGVDTVVFCLSQEFNKLDASQKLEWRAVLDAMLAKRQGDLYVITLRLHESDAPEGLKRWQAINLYERRGYEELMHALQLRAEKVGATLTPSESWKTSFYKIGPEPEELAQTAKQVDARKPFPIWLVVLVGLLVVVGLIFLRPAGRGEDAANQSLTADAVLALAQRATQNVVVRETERAATATAEVFMAEQSRIQTETALTRIPLDKTATAAQALITPTVTSTVVTIPTQIVDTGNILMVLVPEGSFLMGRDDAGSAHPAHVVRLPAYYMDAYEVTNASYQACVNASACQPPTVTASQTRPDYYANYGDYPMINVDWSMARTYCEWRGARLPTEAEWEKAARGTSGILHPWGDDSGCFFANHNNCVGDTTSSDKFVIGKSVYGIFHLAGNVLEWTSSLFMDYPYDATDGREDPASPLPRVLRGGSWASPPSDIFTYTRLSLDPTTMNNEIGFRCVRSAGG